MDLTLTAEQEQVRTTLREFLASEGGTELARRRMAGDPIDALWAGLARLDLTALTVPVEQGGFGEDVDYLALVLEEVGRVAMPGPYLETTAFCVPLVAAAGTPDQRERFLSPVADGDSRMSVALYEPGFREPADAELAAVPDGDGYRLDGEKVLVPDADLADELVVTARVPGADDVTLFVVETGELDVTSQRSLDRSHPLSVVAVDDVHVPTTRRIGPESGGGPELADAIERINVGIAALLVGAAERAVDRAVDHATTREQFGHPIGRFQAVKHRITDMWIETRLAQSLTYYAAWAVATDAPDARRAVSAAKAHAVDTCTTVLGDEIVTHGATGFTWDHDAHLSLKRAQTLGHCYGSPRDHLDRVADERGL